jgi:hypothetical protein
MSALVRFKDCEDYPCIKQPLVDENEAAIWKQVRGKPVLLGRVVTDVPVEDQCDSDTYWEIVDPTIRRIVVGVHGYTFDCMIVCRHVLEMGD